MYVFRHFHQLVAWKYCEMTNYRQTVTPSWTRLSIVWKADNRREITFLKNQTGKFSPNQITTGYCKRSLTDLLLECCSISFCAFKKIRDKRRDNQVWMFFAIWILYQWYARPECNPWENHSNNARMLWSNFAARQCLPELVVYHHS